MQLFDAIFYTPVFVLNIPVLSLFKIYPHVRQNSSLAAFLGKTSTFVTVFDMPVKVSLYYNKRGPIDRRVQSDATSGSTPTTVRPRISAMRTRER